MFRHRTAVALAFVAVAGFPLIARPQSGGDGFLFREPRMGFSLRTGWASARAHSDLYAFTTQELTLDRSDFSGVAFNVDLSWRLVGRTHLVASLGSSGSTKRSEFRDFVDNNEFPIEQTTSFYRVPLTLGVKQYLTATGQTVGRLAWIPARVAPYVGAAGGVMYYRLRQVGDFVDFETMDVFNAQIASSGWTPTVHAFAGLDYSLGTRLAVTAEARYLWGSAELSRDFSGFERLDLSGLATTAGLKVRF